MHFFSDRARYGLQVLLLPILHETQPSGDPWLWGRCHIRGKEKFLKLVLEYQHGRQESIEIVK